jgi:hypothetical protein
MPSTLFAGHAVARGAEHAHANDGVGMPPGNQESPVTDAILAAAGCPFRRPCVAV